MPPTSRRLRSSAKLSFFRPSTAACRAPRPCPASFSRRAALIAPVIFRPWLTSTYLHEAAKHAVRRGVGKHQPLNCLLGARWTWHNRQRIARVPALADPFSRHDMSLAHEHGWRILQPPMHALHRRTSRIIGDTEFAHNVGFDEMPELQEFHQSHITQCGQGLSTSRESPTRRTYFHLLCLGRSPSASPLTGVDLRRENVHSLSIPCCATFWFACFWHLLTFYALYSFRVSGV